MDTLKIIWADSGYGGTRIAALVQTAAAITLDVVKRLSPHAFQVDCRRRGGRADIRMAVALRQANFKIVEGRPPIDERSRSRRGAGSSPALGQSSSVPEGRPHLPLSKLGSV